jgi:hypothetical protein
MDVLSLLFAVIRVLSEFVGALALVAIAAKISCR